MAQPPEPEPEEQNGSKLDDIDPLDIHKLSLNFDYLMFKINDSISNLSDFTYETVFQKQQFIDEEYFEHQLHLRSEIEHTDELIDRCTKLENEFFKLDQLYEFVKDFKKRLNELETQFDDI
jgi:hypothetical protein